MKKKIGITFDSELYRKVKIYCAENGLTISDFIQNAVDMYLTRVEIIEEEIKNRMMEDMIEDNYSQIVKQSIESYVIGKGEE